MTPVTTAFHNGVTTYSLGREGVITGTLTFGVGMSDETPTLAGITHLLEHVVLRLIQPVPVIHSGVVEPDSIEFFATGTADAVANFLKRVADAISTITAVTDEDIRLEKQIIETEKPGSFGGISPGLLTNRFGLRGLGLTVFGGPTTHALTRTELVEWARRWLTRENAALSFTGDVPAALDVRLPSGPPATHKPTPPTVDSPRLVQSTKAGVALSLIVSVEHEAFLGAALHYELLARVRQSSGLIYSIDYFTTRIDDKSVQLDLVLDPLDRNLDAALEASLGAVHDLSQNGFSADAVDSARSMVTAHVGLDEASGSDHLDRLAIDGLRGRVTLDPAETLRAAASLTGTELTRALVASLPSLIVAVHENASLPKKLIATLALPLDRQRIWTRHRVDPARQDHATMRASHRPWHGRSSRNVLWITDSHVLRRDGRRLTSIDLADVVLVGNRVCGCVALVDRWGRYTEIDTAEWKQTKKLHRRLLAAFPPGIVREFPADD